MIHKKILILLLLIVGVIIVSQNVTSFVNDDVLSTYNGRFPIGQEINYYNYDGESKVMTDSNGITFETETNGVVTISGERLLAFALKGTVGGSEIIKTSMDYSWTWHMEVSGTDVLFWAENSDPNLEWKQYYYFYDDPFKPMKIKHYVKNNYQDITNMQMYYLFNNLEGDSMEYDGNKYLMTDSMPIHREGNFNAIIPRINFNEDFDFNFKDLIDDGFIINEFYVGSGNIIGKPSLDITAIGFTKNNGNFPLGASVWVDPTFSTNIVQGLSTTVLNEDTFVLAWCEAVQNDASFLILNANETVVVGETDVDASLGQCSSENYVVSVSAFNSTAFVFAWVDDEDNDITFRIYDTAGNNLTDDIDVDTDAGGAGKGVSVSAFNSTAFVVGWIDTTDGDATIRTYDSSGNAISSEVDADTEVGTPYGVSVSAFNSTTFVVGWFDDVDNDMSVKVFNVDGANTTGIIDVDTAAGTGSDTAQVSTINSTAFSVLWHDESADFISFRTYDIAGNSLTDIIQISPMGSSGDSSVSLATINSTALAVGWFNEFDDTQSFTIVSPDGTEIIPIVNVSTIATSTDIAGISIGSLQVATNIGICGNRLVVAWSDTISSSLWGAFEEDSTAWDGVCPSGAGDTTSPNVTINSPSNTTHATTTIIFNVTALDETAMSSCWYSLDAGIINITMSNITSSNWNATNSSMSQGSHTANFYCNDTSDNINNSESVTFSIDSISPIVTLISPTSGLHPFAVTLAYQVTDASDIDNCTLTTIDRTVLDQTITKDTPQSFLLLSTRDSNKYNWFVTCVDSLGNSGVSSTASINTRLDTGGGGGGNGFFDENGTFVPFNNGTITTTPSILDDIEDVIPLNIFFPIGVILTILILVIRTSKIKKVRYFQRG